MTETRRLAAIMAIDVVGYSRPMGEDEAGTARAVREHREATRPKTFNANERFLPSGDVRGNRRQVISDQRVPTRTRHSRPANLCVIVPRA